MYVSMTPQEAISKGLPRPSECDVVVCILWSRIGTPLPAQYIKEDGSPYKSGTEWEYYNALEGNRKLNKPTVVLYRRMESVQFIQDDPEADENYRQLSSVKKFFNSFVNADGSINGGYNQYATATEFKDEYRRHIRRIVYDLFSEKLPEPQIPPVELKVQLHHNLPSRSYSPYGSLLGREADQQRVMMALESRFPLISIEGMPGVGKSSLALEVAYSCLRQPEASKSQAVTFDYIVWVTAKDKPDQKLWFDDVLNMIARVMDFFAITQKPFTDDKIFEVSALLQSRCTLLIVDNFETIEDPALERWLRSVPEPTKVIVTSQKSQFRMASPIDLEGLEEKDALDLIRRHINTFELDFLSHKSDDELLPLVKNTAGNPLAIVWSLSTLKGGTLTFEELIDDLRANFRNKNSRKIIDYLFAKSWKQLTPYAQKVLSAVPLFVGVDLIAKDALCAATGLSDDDFNNAVDQLIEFKLLQVEYDKTKIRYKVHPLTHTYARNKLNKRQLFEAAARERWSTYFLELIKKSITRTKPDTRYWNVLVSDKMQTIDEEWHSINEVIKWADQSKQDSLFLDLVMLLVHYMDSRFLNLQRMDYVRKAVKIASEMNRKEDEALLSLDALGWTLVEEDDLDRAYRKIRHGFDIANQLDRKNEVKNDLIALGYAWEARVEIEMGNSSTACQLIDKALVLSQTCSSWIKSRVYMAAGDIALKQNRNVEALDFYENQASSMIDYGGEGNGYQVEPRLGLAYVRTGDLEKAEKKFNALRNNEKIPIGKLYGDYGLALVAYKRGETEKASRLANETKEALSRKTASNILLKLINELYQDMESESGNLAD